MPQRMASGTEQVNADIKSQLKSALLSVLDEDIRTAIDAARQAQETASHADNKPENQYDTLSLEAAYLAHGQSERIRELQEIRIRIARWPVTDFDEDDVIAAGALAELTCAGQVPRHFWITPVGGRQLLLDGRTVQVISAQAPLAQQLMGLGVGDEVMLGNQSWEISGCW